MAAFRGRSAISKIFLSITTLSPFLSLSSEGAEAKLLHLASTNQNKQKILRKKKYSESPLIESNQNVGYRAYEANQHAELPQAGIEHRLSDEQAGVRCTWQQESRIS